MRIQSKAIRSAVRSVVGLALLGTLVVSGRGAAQTAPGRSMLVLNEVTVIDVEHGTLLPAQRDYYDVAGVLWKTETFEIETIDGVPTPIRIVMKDLQGKTSTEQRISNVSYDVNIPDALFDPMKLPIAADSPVWPSSGAQAAAGK